MAGIRTNAHQVAVRIEARGPAVERELQAELDVQQQLMIRAARRHAPTFRSELVNSIHGSTPRPFAREVSPGVTYASAQEHGIAPGGKGLPRYFDPASAPIVAWLASRLGGLPRARKARPTFELQLRDRYEGLAWHVRHHGVKATPFMKPAFEERVGATAAALKLAVRRGLANPGATA